MGQSDVQCSVSEFARLAGVTRPMLPFYDEIGRSKPTQHRGNQRKQYKQREAFQQTLAAVFQTEL